MKPGTLVALLALSAVGCGDASSDDLATASLDDATPKSGADGKAVGCDDDALPVDPAAGAHGTLLVAELAAGKEAVHAYSLPDLRLTGTLAGVKLGNHVGALPLPDGRILTTDDLRHEIITIGAAADGKPAVLQRAAAELGSSGSWGCADSALRYFVAGSGRDEGTTQVANVVSLADFTNTKLEVPLNVINGATEELHPALGGEPLHLFAGVGGEVRAWLLADVLAGKTAPVASLPIATGSHGPVITPSALYIATKEGNGFDGVTLAAPFKNAQVIPWDVDGLASGRNARPRLAHDGHTIYGAITQSKPAEPERWAEKQVDLHIADVTSSKASRQPLTTGIVPKFQLSQRYALFANVTAEGDFAILVDVRTASPTYQQVVARIPLPKLVAGPVAGQPIAGKEARASAITPDGRFGFVSHGGEGKISVIDTEARAVVRTLETPTALAGGGYLVAGQRGIQPVDTCAR
ncbi:MAG: hypothetical protein ABW252_04385 [Polyangiales bacterium]